jgi:hypothetical protein
MRPRFPLLPLTALLVLPALSGLHAEDGPSNADVPGFIAPDPAAGPWLERSDAYFRFIFKKADEALVEKYLSISQDAFETVTGYLGAVPKEKAPVIIYGTMDSPLFGGVTSSLPMRIGLDAGQSSYYSPKSLLMHEFTHYLVGDKAKSGWLGCIAGIFSPDLRRAYSLSLSDLSIEGSTSFMDGTRRTELNSLPIRAAVIEGRMWDWDQVSSGGLRRPGALRVYLSGFLIQDWLFDACGDDALVKILDIRDQLALPFDTPAFKRYTGIDFQTAWGEIRSGLEKRYAFARDFPLGVQLSPRDAYAEPQWGSLLRTERGFLHYRSSLLDAYRLGFWRPGESEASKGKPGVLSIDPGRFIPLEGLVSDDFSADSKASVIAAVINDPEDTSLYHDVNRNRIVLARITWNDDGSEARAVDIRKLPGSGFTNPCLAPDGKRLFASIRVSDSYRAAEIDLDSGRARELSLPAGISVTEISVSPDGKRLALALLREGVHDVGLYELDADRFTPITDDEAADFTPSFLADGTLVFSSDRENSIAVYRYEDGSFTREILDAIAAFAPAEDGEGGYYYSSRSAAGSVIRHLASAALRKESIPDFASLRPSWLERRNSIWETYRKKGVVLAAEGAGAGNTASAPSGPRRFADFPKPLAWFPEFYSDAEGYSVGAQVLGMNYLGESSFAAALRYHPESAQLSGLLALQFQFPFMGLELLAGQDYSGFIGADDGTRFRLARYASLNANLPVFRSIVAGTSLWSLRALASLRYGEDMGSEARIGIPESFSLPATRSLRFTPGIGFGLNRSSPAAAMFGGSFLSANARGVLEWTSAAENLGFGALAGAGAGLRLGSGLLSLSGSLAWRGNGSAGAYLPRTVSRWEDGSPAPWRAEAGLEWAVSSLGKEWTDFILLTERGGFILGVKGFFEADADLAPRFIPELEFSLEYERSFVAYYQDVPLRIGAGYRLPFEAPEGSLLDPVNFCLKLSFMGIGVVR